MGIRHVAFNAQQNPGEHQPHADGHAGDQAPAQSHTTAGDILENLQGWLLETLRLLASVIFISVTEEENAQQRLTLLMTPFQELAGGHQFVQRERNLQ